MESLRKVIAGPLLLRIDHIRCIPSRLEKKEKGKDVSTALGIDGFEEMT